MKYKAIISFLAAMLMTVPVLAETNAKSDDIDNEGRKLTWIGRLGYNLGGTAPMGIPASIRSIDTYRLTPSFMGGVDVVYSFTSKIGLLGGLRVELKDMDSEVSTKGYRMKVKMDEDEMEGYYTGHVRQKVHMLMVTLPIQFRYDLSRVVALKIGPYVSYLFDKNFSGYAFDGYLRKDDPTGAKVVMGTKEGEWATYEFPDDMRRWQFGIGVGADFTIYRGFGVSADLNWGLNGLMKSSFKTVDQVLYPIYGTIGIFCKLK